jgi:hypothetical protein
VSPAAASWPGGSGEEGQRHIKIKKEMTKAQRSDKRGKRKGMKKNGEGFALSRNLTPRQPDRLKERQKGDKIERRDEIYIDRKVEW